ncbi:succinylglutamate desuccinylase/aspartoacylase family protein [Ahrensia sp. R2A130]|uniref:succinylglutamate desuccinylase/aspartoacylase family protein n=1 Tax=Ahrensia sp. R2A130 TaxID=744979 RepID=UPI0001E0D154|nr:succinylglutamate desuccinylase/aspartoacylase family protein [Ahrensia sp. R2A130]EFL87685.1 succinylglutamate desuccinylase/aspartoacylase family protein [Ahrensia sp. R2A130]
MSSKTRDGFTVGEHTIDAGTRKTVDLPVSVLSDHTPVTLSVHVVHGKRPGPVLFVSAAVHGDEVIGAEIVRRLLRTPALRSIRGTLLAIPIVNAFGLMNHSRYLPDRRDLNRSFPGSPKGSLASRLAHLFLTEIVERSDLGIDLHSAAVHRTNLPQVRVTPDRPEVMELAHVFGAPLTLTSKIRPGSLRDAADKKGVNILLYEAGEGLRFDEFAVRAGVSGILRIMRHLDMIPGIATPKRKLPTIVSRSSSWLRAPAGGLLRSHKNIGEAVTEGDILGTISDPFGEEETPVVAEFSGLMIGRTHLPIVNEGDGLFHVARIGSDIPAEKRIDGLTSELEDDVLLDEDEII